MKARSLSNGFQFWQGMLLHTWQEEEAAALQDVKDEESGSDSDSSASSSSGSSSSGIGLRKGQGKPKAKAKAKGSKKKPEPVPEVPPDTARTETESLVSMPKSEKSTPTEKGGKALTDQALMEKGQACLKSLKETSGWGIWNGSFKVKEVDSLVTKGLDFSVQSEKRGGATFSSLASELTQESNRLSQESELCQILGGTKGKDTPAQEILTSHKAQILSRGLASSSPAF